MSLHPRAAATTPGKVVGGKISEHPGWFKESFLEFEEDVAEASRQNKRVMIYFHQDGCPYCAKLVDENFTDPQIESFVKTNFDGIAINMWGDREVVTVGGKDFTEYFARPVLQMILQQPLVAANRAGQYDIVATASGGGLSCSGRLAFSCSPPSGRFWPRTPPCFWPSACFRGRLSRGSSSAVPSCGTWCPRNRRPA